MHSLPFFLLFKLQLIMGSSPSILPYDFNIILRFKAGNGLTALIVSVGMTVGS